MNMIQSSPLALGAPVKMAASPRLPQWRPAPHKWTPRRYLGRARLGQYGPLGIDFPLIGLAIDVGAGVVAYAALRKTNPKGAMLYITWAVLVLSGLRGLYDAARLVGVVLGPKA